ncbi:MAG: hypothetical protein H7A46_12035 [Verrucomicrobiales bacterium]|nr:hypothetical protein [Verrucomicrobiales bacterium]
MRTHLLDPQMRRTRFAPPGWLLLLPILMASIQAQLPDLKIGVDSILLTWAPTGEECIVVCAESLDGPWTPVPVPIREVDGQCQAIVKCSGQQQYFRLKKGACFVEDFDEGFTEGWNIFYPSPEAEEAVNFDYSCGHLRITCTDLGETWPAYFGREELLAGDFALSIDILDWNPDSTDRVIVCLHALANVEDDDVEQLKFYDCGWTIFGGPIPVGKSLLWTLRWDTMDDSKYLWDWDYLNVQLPERSYRLMVTGTHMEFGPQLRLKLTMQLFNRDTGELIKQETGWDTSPLAPGSVGFHVYGPEDGTGTIDVTLDNYIAVVIPPE